MIKLVQLQQDWYNMGSKLQSATIRYGASLGLTVDHFMMSGANGLFDFMDSQTKANFLSKYQDKSIEMNNFIPQLTLDCK